MHWIPVLGAITHFNATKLIQSNGVLSIRETIQSVCMCTLEYREWQAKYDIAQINDRFNVKLIQTAARHG